MKRLALGLLAFGLQDAIGAEGPTFSAGQIVHMTRTSPVFEKPSPQAKSLGDADSGTLLILKNVSPKGSWLYLQDEDGNSGWVPRDRTDFKPIPTAADFAKADAEAKKEDKRESAFKEESEESATEQTSILPGRHRSEWALTGRWVLKDPSNEFGFMYSYLVLDPAERGRANYFGLQAGVLRAGTAGWDFPFRFRMLRRGYGSSFGMGPDLSVIYGRRLAQSQWNFGLGYSVALLPLGASWFCAARAGAEFMKGFRVSGELTIGLDL